MIPVAKSAMMSKVDRISRNNVKSVAKKAIAVLSPLPLFLAHQVTVATAASGNGSTRKMIEVAFNPVIELLQGVAYPVAFLMISGGFIAFTLGQRSRGIEMIKWAAIGYLGLQLAPSMMEIIVEVGLAMRQSQAMTH